MRTLSTRSMTSETGSPAQQDVLRPFQILCCRKFPNEKAIQIMVEETVDGRSGVVSLVNFREGDGLKDNMAYVDKWQREDGEMILLYEILQD